MGWHEEFRSSGNSFEARIGAPDKLDAAVGQIASNLATLDGELSRANAILRKVAPGKDADREMPFERKLELFASLCRRPSTLARLNFGDTDPLESLSDLLSVVKHAAQLGRNAIYASAKNVFRRYGGARERPLREPLPLRGFIARFDLLDAADLLDIADYIACVHCDLEEDLLLVYDDHAKRQDNRT